MIKIIINAVVDLFGIVFIIILLYAFSLNFYFWVYKKITGKEHE